jgi:LysR family pca operon transcriptional activator
MSRARSSLSRRLKLSHFRVIAAISHRGSLLKASASLGLTQPAITRSLHEIEMIVGARLFERHAKGVTPNRLGLLMADSARRVLGELDSFERDLDRQIENGQDLVLIGALPSAAAGILPAAIRALQGTHAQVRVRVTQGQTGELIEALSSGDVDVVLGRLYPSASPDHLERIELYQDQVALLARAGHPIFLKSPISSASVNEYQLALPSSTPYAATEMEELIERLMLQRAVCLESNSVPLIRETLLHSDMITILPRLMLAGDIARGQIREISALPVAGGRSCGLILRRNVELSANTELFISFLREAVAELLPAIGHT